MKELEKSLKALANRRRLMIIKLLSRHEASVGEIAASLRLSIRSTSKHLAILAHADILEREQKSLNVYYRMAPTLKPFIKEIITIL